MTLLTALSLLFFSSTDGGAAEPEALIIEADGFSNSAGHAIARLYSPGMEVTQEPRLSQSAPIIEKRARFEFKALPPGTYAVVVVHDQNDNGRIDHALGLFPKEPLGFSHGFRLSLFSGMPTFEKLSFTFAAEATTQSVTVR